MTAVDHVIATLLAILEGCTFGSAMMPWGKQGPIVLPSGDDDRRALVLAHIEGKAAEVTYCPTGGPSRIVSVARLVLFALCPAADDLCRFVCFDLDSADGHGSKGLLDPVRAAACIAERCDALGLLGGLIVARSRNGKGRHVWLILPCPVPLEDAVVAAGGLAVHGLRIANQDAVDTDRPHAFLCGDGQIGQIGRSGTWELIPHSTHRPKSGWSLMLPAAGALASHGGGVIVDPFSFPSEPIELLGVPRCDGRAWQRFLCETKSELDRRKSSPRPKPHRPRTLSDPLTRIDPRTKDFLDGNCAPGERNRSLFVAVTNMLGVGVPGNEVEELAYRAALTCGLSDREARTTIRSAFRAKGMG